MKTERKAVAALTMKIGGGKVFVFRFGTATDCERKGKSLSTADEGWKMLRSAEGLVRAWKSFFDQNMRNLHTRWSERKLEFNRRAVRINSEFPWKFN